MLDVAVVGAGPAGLSAAAALLQCGSKPLRVEVSVAPASGEMLTMHKPLRKMRQCFAIDLHGRLPLCRVIQATTFATGVTGPSNSNGPQLFAGSNGSPSTKQQRQVCMLH